MEPQIAQALRRTEQGAPAAEVCRKLGVSAATFCAWKKKYAAKKGPRPSLPVADAERPQGEPAVAIALVVLILAGCAPAMHPRYPGERYATIEQCEHHARQQHDDPSQCEKHVDMGYSVKLMAATVLAVYIAIVGPLLLIGGATSGDTAKPSPADTVEPH